MSANKISLSRIKHALTRNIVLSIALLSTIFVFTVIFLSDLNRPSRATPEFKIDSSALTPNSEVIKDNSHISFLLESREGEQIIKTQNTRVQAAFEIMQKILSYSPEDLRQKAQDGTLLEGLLPPDILKQVRLKRTVDDSKDKYLRERGFNLSNEHYVFEQRLGDIPVIGSHLAVHIKNGNEVYRISGNLVEQKSVPAARLTEEHARQIALSTLGDQDSQSKTDIVLTEQAIINKKLLGLGEDDRNILTLGVGMVERQGDVIVDSKTRYVDLTTGEIVFEKEHSAHALRRQIADCANSHPQCKIVRQEGAPPTSDQEVNNAYDYFGDFYKYLQNTYQRDGYNNQGPLHQIFVRVPKILQAPCPNAGALWSADKTNVQFHFCPNMAVRDIVGHEYTHALILFTADLLLQNQSGALAESIADMFGYALDPDDWTFGEGSQLGAFRYLDDPTKSPAPNGPQADRLFSGNYYCGNNQSSYLHLNTGPANKAFYLMIAGGDFNGCQVAGQGVDKIMPIVYRALSVYLGPTSNFRAFYDGMLRACADLYQESSATCSAVRQAMQAAELDQQGISAARGPVCQNISAKPASCRGAQPTVGPTGTPAPTPTGGHTLETDPVIPPLCQGVSADIRTNTQTIDPGEYNLILDNPLPAGHTLDILFDDTTAGPWTGCSQVLAPDRCDRGLTPPDSLTPNDPRTFGRYLFEAGHVYRVLNYQIKNGCVARQKEISTITVTGGSFVTPSQPRQTPTNLPISPTITPAPSITQAPAPTGLATPTPTPRPTATSTPAPNPTATPIPPSPTVVPAESMTLALTLRFQGILEQPKSGIKKVNVELGINGGRLEKTFFKTILFEVGQDGLWRGTLTLFGEEGVYPANNYKLLVKGPKHLRKRICSEAPRDQAIPGDYHCVDGQISLKNGNNKLDFSKIFQLSGDLPSQAGGKQDGVVNSMDLVFIVKSIGSTDKKIVDVADLNFDGIVDTQDYSLAIATLGQKFDED